ncbi:hypothetical protein [Longispora albida]|uniref:hypothetical protein n=1 Tax=Longispora albida TaxID=203523 RepID=UPI0003655E79|nr:hypothetical protein [Longispora albida]
MNLHIDPDKMETFAKSSDQRQKDFNTQATKMKETQLPEDAFGRIPFFSHHLYSIYNDHVKVCLDGIESAATVMTGIANGVRAVVANHEAGDAAMKTDLQAMEDAMGNTKIKGMGQ